MARPKKVVRKTADLHVRFDPDERAMLAEKAALAGISASEYIRKAALGKRIHSKEKYQVLADAIRELSRLGGLQKLLAMRDPANKSEYKKLFHQIECQLTHVVSVLDALESLP